MGRQLPVPRSAIELEELPRRSGNREPASPAPSRLRSPLGSALSELAPDLVRLAGRMISHRLHSRDLEPTNQPESKPGASGLTISEVEINLAAPLIRRVVVRSATAWTLAPDLIKSDSDSSGVSRKWPRKLGAGVAGLAGLATVVLAARRRLGQRS